MAFLETIFATAATLIGFFFAILGIIGSLKEKKKEEEKFFSLQSLRIAILSLMFFFATFFLSLALLLLEDLSILYDKGIVDVILSVCLGCGMLLMIFSLKMLLEKL